MEGTEALLIWLREALCVSKGAAPPADGQTSAYRPAGEPPQSHRKAGDFLGGSPSGWLGYIPADIRHGQSRGNLGRWKESFRAAIKTSLATP